MSAINEFGQKITEINSSLGTLCWTHFWRSIVIFELENFHEIFHQFVHYPHFIICFQYWRTFNLTKNCLRSFSTFCTERNELQICCEGTIASMKINNTSYESPESQLIIVFAEKVYVIRYGKVVKKHMLLFKKSSLWVYH